MLTQLLTLAHLWPWTTILIDITFFSKLGIKFVQNSQEVGISRSQNYQLPQSTLINHRIVKIMVHLESGHTGDHE